MEIIVRAVVIYTFLWLLLRAMGRRELAQMSAFELVVLVTIGDLVQQGVTQEDFSMTGAMLAVSTFGLLAVATSTISVRFGWTKPLLEGRPLVVIADGRIVEEALRAERLDLDELKQEARLKGIGNLSDVRWCVLEVDGRFSFLTDVIDDQRAAEAEDESDRRE